MELPPGLDVVEPGPPRFEPLAPLAGGSSPTGRGNTTATTATGSTERRASAPGSSWTTSRAASSVAPAPDSSTSTAPAVGAGVRQQQPQQPQQQQQQEHAICVRIVFRPQSRYLSPFSPSMNDVLRQLEQSLNVAKITASRGVPRDDVKVQVVDIDY
jgi:hypothetical protein